MHGSMHGCYDCLEVPAAAYWIRHVDGATAAHGVHDAGHLPWDSWVRKAHWGLKTRDQKKKEDLRTSSIDFILYLYIRSETVLKMGEIKYSVQLTSSAAFYFI